MKQILSLTAAGLLTAAAAFAAPFAPVGTNTALPANSFGGSGIPTDNVMTATSAGGLLVGLSAHARFVGPLATDAAGTFFAPTGSTAPALSNNGTWNFNYIVDATNTASGLLSTYTYRLTVGSDALGTLSFDPVALIPDNSPTGSTSKAGNSENPGFNFLVFPSGVYDPNISDVYAVKLEALDGNGNVIATSAININVGASSVPDAGSTFMMLGLAVAGIAGLRRKLAV